MMKKFFFAALCAASFALTGCDKDTEGVTGVTYYAVIDLDGDATVTVDKGSEFVDPGFSATLDGVDVTSDVDVVSDVDVTKSGVYSVKYSFTNADGFTSSSSRTVLVFDKADKMEGIYSVTAKSYRDYDGTVTEFGEGCTVVVINNGESYDFSDIMGGWYSQRAGYGSAYALAADISLNDDNSLTHNKSYCEGWGDSANAFEGKFNEASNTITFHTVYNGGAINFYVTMKKNK